MMRGTFEKPPDHNDLGWRRQVTVFTPQGAETVYATVWEYPDGRPCEIFLACSKQGSLVDQFLRECGKNYSRLLQAGVPVGVLVEKLRGEHGPIAGGTSHPSIKEVTGIQDLVGHLLTLRYGGKA